MTVQTQASFAVVCCLLSCALAAPAAAQSSHVIYFGDSLASETLDTVTEQLEDTGQVTVSSSTFPGLALCDFLEVENAAVPAVDRIYQRVLNERPDVVVLQFWGNPFTECIRDAGFDTEAYYNQYFWNALNAGIQVGAAADAAGVARPTILWVLQGPQSYNPPLPAGTKSRPERLNEIYTFAANYFGDAVSDAGFHVSLAATFAPPPGSRYTWTQYLPCTDAERGTPLCTHPEAYGGVTQIHKADDHVHFCLGDLSEWWLFFSCGSTTPSPGIVRYGTRIADDVKAQLGL